jgi:hypothetical protein
VKNAAAKRAASRDKARRSLNTHPDLLVETLCQLTDEQLVVLLQEVLARRVPEGTSHHTFFLGIAFERESAAPPSWTIGAVAYPPKEGTTDERGFAQHGTCRWCQIQVASWEKTGTCPLCGHVVTLT